MSMNPDELVSFAKMFSNRATTGNGPSKLSPSRASSR